MSARGARSGAVALAAALAGACGGDKVRPVGPAAEPALDGGADDLGSGSGDEADADGPPLEELIAAIEHAMNELAPLASQCWAAAAAEDLAVAGRVRKLVAVGRAGGAAAEASLDEPGRPVLIRCLTGVLAAYPWAPPLRGQTVELPFAFTAPRMQNVIDRRLVPHRAQAGVDIAVLLDQLNSANAAVSLLEVAVASGARVGPREVERAELWLFRTPARVGWAGAPGGATVTVARGAALWIPRGALVHVEAAASAADDHAAAVNAVVAIVPGGREGSARAGALPGITSVVPVKGRTYPQPVLVPAGAGTQYPRPGGVAMIRLEPGVPVKAIGRELALLDLQLEAGAAVPAHVHAGETEVLYLLRGGGTMTIGGASVPVTEHSVVQIPPGVEHAFTASATTLALQLYTPAGPEQRFKKTP